MIIATGIGKTFDIIQHPFIIEIFSKMGIEGTCLNVIKVIYDKPTVNIILDGKIYEPFPSDQEQNRDIHF